MKRQFKVKAIGNIQGTITKGKVYEVYNVSFPKLNPEGLFYIYCDNGSWKRITSIYFEPMAGL